MRAQPQGPRAENKDAQSVRRRVIREVKYPAENSLVSKTAVHSDEPHTSAAQDPSTSEDCTPNRWCYNKCPGGRWVNNGWIDVEDTLPLMSDDYLPENEFVYLDIGCKVAEEVQFVLKRYPRAKVVAMEMRQEMARKCEANAKAMSSDGQSITVLNQAAATSSTRGAFEVRGDSSSIISAADLEGGKRKGTEIDFVTLDSVWRKYLAPSRINLMKLDAEGWDGLILKHGCTPTSMALVVAQA
ncbi:hypothetical protein CYMTET_49801 [Cymbomonas tetramitiformis]|uniref:Methyltransferase FkbM domain-containing protein n=1 Tax=Cymbomonas tetramitiformis TaxID=36881 RepID=A0AAE0EUC6_9CHLO|nr:hypothetical protein CYMTET_49801 [Cymbomonas tetramitiformis]